MVEGLTFDEAAHVYRHAGHLVPGVTSVLRPLSSFDRVPPGVLEAKADLGRRVHFATQLDDENDLDEDSIEPDVAPYLFAWRRFRADTRCEVLQVERQVFDPTYRFAGSLDRVLGFDGGSWLVDLKTCFTTPRSAGPQTAAYMRALGDFSVDRRAALRLRPDGTYRLDHLHDANDWPVFLSCLTLHRFTEAHP